MAILSVKRGDTIKFKVQISTTGVNLDTHDVAGMMRRVPTNVRDRGEKLADVIVVPVVGSNSSFVARVNPIDTNRFPVGTDSVSFDFQFTSKTDATEVISTETMTLTILEDSTYVN